mgnify:CR=1 FL=1
MNDTSISQQQMFELYEMVRSLRDELLDVLTDDDLAATLPGENPTFGAMLRELGETQAAYLESFKTFTLTWGVRYGDDAVETDIEALRMWFAQLDADVLAALKALSPEDFAGKIVKRDGFEIPVQNNLLVYREALFIAYGKAAVYLKAISKPLPGRWPLWIG